jgi:serine protease Do
MIASTVRGRAGPGTAAAVWLAITAAAASPAAAQTRADVLDTVLPAVVAVAAEPAEARPAVPRGPGSPFEAFLRDFVDPPGEAGREGGGILGSGVVVDPAGWIVTTAHVVAGAATVTVVLDDRRRLPARLVGADEATDVALLKVEAGRPLPAVRWGDSDRLRVGDWLVAVGNPFGLGPTVSAGIVSARARDIQQGPYDDFIQTDAAINRGSSGGPLFDARGDLIAIGSALLAPAGGSVGIGFAIPAAVVRPIVEQLRAEGRVRRGWLGVQVQTLTPEIADALGIASPRGALVAAVTPGAPADRAGLRPGDVVVGFAGRPVARMRDLPRLVAATAPGRRADLRLLRRGRETVVPVEVGELAATAAAAVPDVPEPRGFSGSPAAGTPALAGLTVAPLDRALRDAFGVAPDVVGVMVTGVADDSPAARQGLAAGDVLVAVGETPVTTPDALRRAVDQQRRAGRPSAVVLVNRGGSVRYVALPLG